MADAVHNGIVEKWAVPWRQTRNAFGVVSSLRQLVVALAEPVQAERKADALFGGLEDDEGRGLGGRSWPSSLSSITTSATQPLGRHRTKPARPTSWLSSFRPRPEGRSTPSGATTRISLLFWSAVFSTITVRPALERSSATTLWIRAHCSPWAPGGVSQRICQSPWTDRTAPCARAAWLSRAARRRREGHRASVRSRTATSSLMFRMPHPGRSF